ncbi:Gibberellin 2-beta-dioxygenase 7 [Platanthera zijinensis]|uniref:Gibberellin 2-beta-dioxygenase 7 n=1 Tax=Platanthera zijinensis TaxID=2320716 RepID=A0AAP0BQX1_9ASPA
MVSSASAAADPSYPPLPPCATAPPPFPGEKPFDVPVIDMENLESERLGDVCRSLGIFRLVNHGLPREVSSRLRAEARKIFELPFERKREEMSVLGRGRPVVYFWGTPIVGLSVGSVNWLEGLQVPLALLQDGDCGDPVCSDFLRTLAAEYGKHMIRIVRTLFDSLALDLKLDPGLSDSYMNASSGIFRSYRYPCLPECQSYMGMRSHTDSSVLAVVDEDEVGGLQIQQGNTWFCVMPVPDTLIVNIGDMMQVISNDEYRSVVHRVLANRTSERTSLCFFAFPKEDFKIRSLSYKEFTYKEFNAQVHEDVMETGDKIGLKKFLIS